MIEINTTRYQYKWYINLIALRNIGKQCIKEKKIE